MIQVLMIGCMTGTSLDGLDVAMVQLTLPARSVHPLSARAEFIAGHTLPLGQAAAALRKLADQHALTAREIVQASHEFSLQHARAVYELEAMTSRRADAICVHGQTVLHAPPLSWQLFNPSVLRQASGRTIISDLRAADLAAGGQGAPITPIADWLYFRHRANASSNSSAAVVNLGGFCNVTLLPAATATMDQPALFQELAQIRGMDVCACNHVLDHIAHQLLDQPFDSGGSRALRGLVHAPARTELMDRLSRQGAARRSLGTGDEVLEWITQWQSTLNPDDVAAAACAAIGATIAKACAGADTIYLAGGGTHNAALVQSIVSGCPMSRVLRTDDTGLPAAFREAAHMGILGFLCLNNVPITLPQVTGVPAPAPISGSILPAL